PYGGGEHMTPADQLSPADQDYVEELSGAKDAETARPAPQARAFAFDDDGFPTVPVPFKDPPEEAADAWLDAVPGLTSPQAALIAQLSGGPPQFEHHASERADPREAIAAFLRAIFPRECITRASIKDAYLDLLALSWLFDPGIFGGISQRALAELVECDPSTISRRVQAQAARFGMPIPCGFTPSHKAAVIMGKFRAKASRANANSPAAKAA
ncbi:MAG: hypothetical protein WBM14_11860, partial [Terracidiphilus sp.]